jgi:hypothetical protein
MSRTLGRPTYANITSTLALVVALGAGGAYAANTVTSKDIVDGQVKAADLHRNSVGSSTIKERSVAAPDMAAGSVASTSLQDGAVRAEHLAAGSVSSVTVEEGSLKGSDLATGTIGTFSIGDGQVMGSDLGPNSVTTAKLQDGQVQNADLGSNAVSSAKVQDNSLTLADMVGADAVLNVSVSGLAASRCSQAGVSLTGAAAGQVGFASTTSTVATGIGFAVLRVTDGAVTLNVCNLTGAAATFSNQPVRVVTFG